MGGTMRARVVTAEVLCLRTFSSLAMPLACSASAMDVERCGLAMGTMQQRYGPQGAMTLVDNQKMARVCWSWRRDVQMLYEHHCCCTA